MVERKVEAARIEPARDSLRVRGDDEKGAPGQRFTAPLSEPDPVGRPVDGEHLADQVLARYRAPVA